MNRCAVEPHFPVKNQEEVTRQLAGSRYHYSLDLRHGYHKLPLTPFASKLLAMTTPCGMYLPITAPFGLHSLLATFQMLMSTKVLDGVDGQGIESFIDDLVCHAPDFETTLQRLRDLFERLDQWDLRINGNKSTLNRADCVFLGHKVDSTGHYHLDSRISALKDMERPHNKSQLKSWLGLVNYFCSYAGTKVADLLAPILQLTKKDTIFTWGQAQELAFAHIKEAIIRQQKLYFWTTIIQFM